MNWGVDVHGFGCDEMERTASVAGAIHEVMAGHDTLYYDSGGDDHPNTAGNVKAAGEFVPLLDKWYEDFLARP